MDRQIEIAYLGEIHDQSLIAERAYKRILAAVSLHRTPLDQRRPPVPDQELVAVLHESVIGFLEACATISKFFAPFPQRRTSPEGARALLRGEQLQHSVEVDLQADAFMPREVRNAMDHVDERMDEWLSGRPYFQHTWAVIWSGDGFADRVGDALRVFNAETMEVSVLGEVANIRQMYEALVDLDRSLTATTADLSMSFALPGTVGDTMSLRSPRAREPGPPPTPPS